MQLLQHIIALIVYKTIAMKFLCMTVVSNQQYYQVSLAQINVDILDIPAFYRILSTLQYNADEKYDHTDCLQPTASVWCD